VESQRRVGSGRRGWYDRWQLVLSRKWNGLEKFRWNLKTRSARSGSAGRISAGISQHCDRPRWVSGHTEEFSPVTRSSRTKRRSPLNVAHRIADCVFEPRAIPTLRMGAGPPHHVVVWLFSNLYWQFEFTPLRHRFPSLRILRPKRRNSLRLRSAVLSRQEYLGVLQGSSGRAERRGALFARRAMGECAVMED
jgi:hypothetical protein